MNSFTTPVVIQIWFQPNFLTLLQTRPDQSQKYISQKLSDWDVYLALSAVNIYVFKNFYLNGNKVEAALSHLHSGRQGGGGHDLGVK